MGIKVVQEIIDFLRRKETYYTRSFSQTGEDVIILSLVKALGLKNFSWIDIGAHHPMYFSNTALFYRKGYRGINVEADPKLINEFYRKRPKDVNLNVLVNDKPGTIPFYIMDVPTLNTLSEEKAHEMELMGHKIIEKKELKAMTISEIIDKYNNGVFPDFLTLDVEGCDLEILKTIDWTKTTPKIICVESVPYSIDTQDNFEYMRNNEMTKFILDKGYYIAAYTSINTIFMKKELIKKSENK